MNQPRARQKNGNNDRLAGEIGPLQTLAEEKREEEKEHLEQDRVGDAVNHPELPQPESGAEVGRKQPGS